MKKTFAWLHFGHIRMRRQETGGMLALDKKKIQLNQINIKRFIDITLNISILFDILCPQLHGG
jgi:hypothetical protein